MYPPVVVVAAHPDDEAIGAASLLLEADDAAVIHLTDGAPRDPRLRPPGQPDRAAYARIRRGEALAALANAGLGPEDVIALGAVDQEAAHALAPLARELASVLRLLSPRFVVTHPFEGGHPDHDVAALAARAAIALTERRGVRAPRLVEMTSYHLAGDTLVTGAFLPGSPQGHRRPLSRPEQLTKRRMLECHASQRDVLAPFRVDEERFRRAPGISLSSRPHAPPLHYEAMGWLTYEEFHALASDALAALGLRPDDAWWPACGGTG
jgi:N-acetylglucosamine malate deacetylase 2